MRTALQSTSFRYLFKSYKPPQSSNIDASNTHIHNLRQIASTQFIHTINKNASRYNRGPVHHLSNQSLLDEQLQTFNTFLLILFFLISIVNTKVYQYRNNYYPTVIQSLVKPKVYNKLWARYRGGNVVPFQRYILSANRQQPSNNVRDIDPNIVNEEKTQRVD